MRLVECKIENFGKLSQKRFVFHEGCTFFCQENGWGKSTLAAFLKVMFFGFENERGRDAYNNQRRRFEPWQGDVYGGEITFETGGSTYIFNRVFGRREKEDTFVLRDGQTLLPSKDFSVNIGEELFQIDRESFARTVFLAQMDCETDTTSSINAKIGNLEDLSDDMKNYEKADRALKERLDKMAPRRKTGLLYKKREEISQKQALIEEGKVIGSTLKHLQEERERLQKEEKRAAKEQDDLQEKQKEIGAQLDLQAKKEKYQLLCQAYEERNAAKEERERYFPYRDRIPQEEEMTACMNLVREYQQAEKDLEHYRLSEEEETAFRDWYPVFAGETFSSGEWEDIADRIRKLPELRYAAAGKRLTEDEEEELRRYGRQFVKGVPDDHVIEELQRSWKAYETDRHELQTKEVYLRTYQEMQRDREREKESRKASLVLPAGILLFLLGAACLFVNLGIGTAGMFLGVILAVVGLLGSRKRKAAGLEPEENSYQRMTEEIEEERIRQQAAEKIFRDFFAEYGMEYEEDLAELKFVQLRESARNYQKLTRKKEEYDRSNQDESYRQNKSAIRAFFQKYLPGRVMEESEYSEVFRRMEAAWDTCRSCIEKKNAAQKTIAEAEGRKQKIMEFLSEYGFQQEEDLYEQLSSMRDHLLGWKTACREWKRALEDKEKMEREEGLENLIGDRHIASGEGQEASMEELAVQAQKLAEERENLSRSIMHCNQQIEEKEEIYNDRMEEKERLQILKEEYEEGKKKYHRMEQARKYLEMAKNSFTQKYMEPVMSGFEKYYTMLTGHSAGQYQMDASTRLTVNEQGLPREIRFLSSGNRDLTGICMRMALIDAMYQKEKPFIILDDPFLNLDRERTERGMAFLKEIEKEYQIIYFTCHESRSLSGVRPENQ